MFVTGVGACLSRIVWIYTIFQIHHTPEILYWSYPMSWILTLSMHAVCFFVIYRQSVSYTHLTLPTKRIV